MSLSTGTVRAALLGLALVTAGALGPDAPAAAPAWQVASPNLTIAQLQYDGGGDWYANPSALPNLLRAIREHTGLPVADQPVTVRLDQPDLWRHPYLYLTGHGNIRLSDGDVGALRRYLESGGFLHADDNYGLDESFRREIARVFPDRELVPLPREHPVFSAHFELPGLPKIHQHDGQPPQAFGIFHEGRLVVFYSYESDLGDGWEDPEVHDDPPEIREAALRMGVNLFVHALAQVAS